MPTGSDQLLRAQHRALGARLASAGIRHDRTRAGARVFQDRRGRPGGDPPAAVLSQAEAAERRSGQVRPLYEAQQAIAAGGFEAENVVAVEVHAGRVVFAAEAASRPQELWLTDLAFRAPKPITRLSGRVGDIRLGERRVVTWTDADGTRRSGILLLPSGYRPDVRYPLILWVYEQAVPYSVNTFGLAGQTAFNLH